MSDDDGMTRPDRLRKLAADESKYGSGSVVDRARKKFQLETTAIDDEAASPDSVKAKGNPMRAVGCMRYIK